jgi:AraC-like DNA-binding protein
MSYKEIKPTGILSNFVQSFWYYETAEKAVSHTILPDGYFDLIAEFDSHKITRVKLTGMWTTPKDIQIPENTTFFAIRFKLLALEYFFKTEIKSILNTALNLPLSFWNIDSFTYDEFEKFVTVVSENLNSELSRLNEIDNRKLKLFEFVYQHQIKTVSEISTQIFWSSRQINRYFNSRFGIPLKEFLKIVRCNAAYHEISNGNLKPQNDFFDQAHFIKEIKKYSHTTPTELHKNKNDRFLQLSTRKEK